jgi:hypothetical protein
MLAWENLIMVTTRINISELKQFVLTKVSKDAPLYSVILCEPDDMDIVEFLLQVKLWLKLSRGRLA